MPRNLARDQQLREERTRQILDSATRMFARKGMLTNMNDIAKDAGLSRVHIYNYFESKEQILLSIIQQGQNRRSEILSEALKLNGNALKKLRYITEQYIFTERRGEGYFVLLQAHTSDILSESDKSAIRQRTRDNLAFVISIIEEGQKEGIIMEGDPVRLATLFTTLQQNLLLTEMRGFDRADETTLELLLQMFSVKASS
jgi:AcrR family transcriptional regulator